MTRRCLFLDAQDVTGKYLEPPSDSNVIEIPTVDARTGSFVKVMYWRHKMAWTTPTMGTARYVYSTTMDGLVTDQALRAYLLRSWIESTPDQVVSRMDYDPTYRGAFW